METDKVRLDKWLWAARFYKTRSLAREAVEGGKVHYNQQRAKPTQSVRIGAVVSITQQGGVRDYIVRGVVCQRRSAKEAQLLYQETEESQLRYAQWVAARNLQKASGVIISPKKPTKRQRQQLVQFKEQWHD